VVEPPEVHILSVGTALPGLAVDNATLARRLKMPAAWVQWVDAFVGTRQRYFAFDLDSGDVRYSLTDLGETAGRRALEAAGVAPGDVDLMVMGTASPDKLMPTTVDLIADRLGIDGLTALQLQSGCTGAVQALHVACQMLQSGQYSTALVLGADSCAKHFDVHVDVTSLAPSEQINAVLFGDGAGAAVLSTSPARASAVIRHTFVRLVGLGRPPGQIVEWFGRADRNSTRTPVVEDYKAIEDSVPVMASEALEELLDHLDWTDEDVDYLLPPQLSGVMTARIVERMKAGGAHEVSCVKETGNTANALPFFQLESALPRMVAGDRAVAVSIESSKWIKAGFALEKI